MSNEQKFVLAPVEPTEEMIESAASFGHTFGYSKQRGNESVDVWADMLKAAPPPPESVLSADDLLRIAEGVLGMRSYSIQFARAIERAVLQRLQGESREQSNG